MMYWSELHWYLVFFVVHSLRPLTFLSQPQFQDKPQNAFFVHKD